jgi:hypothetical protein
MFELLPKQRIARAKRSYYLRYAAASAWVFAAVGFAWVIVLTPSTYVAWLRVATLDDAVVAIDETKKKEGQAAYNATVKVIAAVADVAASSVPHPDDVFDVVEEATGSITTESIDVTLAEDLGSYRLSFVGLAPTRVEAVAFAQRLRDTNKFVDVDVPLSSLVKERDVSFTLVAKYMISTTTKTSE